MEKNKIIPHVSFDTCSVILMKAVSKRKSIEEIVEYYTQNERNDFTSETLSQYVNLFILFQAIKKGEIIAEISPFVYKEILFSKQKRFASEYFVLSTDSEDSHIMNTVDKLARMMLRKKIFKSNSVFDSYIMADAMVKGNPLITVNTVDFIKNDTPIHINAFYEKAIKSSEFYLVRKNKKYNCLALPYTPANYVKLYLEKRRAIENTDGEKYPLNKEITELINERLNAKSKRAIKINSINKNNSNNNRNSNNNNKTNRKKSSKYKKNNKKNLRYNTETAKNKSNSNFNQNISALNQSDESLRS